MIARRDSGDYAFHRGAATIPIPEPQQTHEGWGEGKQQMDIQDYLQNVIKFNDLNRDVRQGAWQSELKKTRKGVQIKQASD
ncbi:MAG: hypothetical protein COB10_10900 [Planctomycetota bacterium]|nr:MAG: hypothetical protein COB10_10900 [Planctomycetota bacterium]